MATNLPSREDLLENLKLVNIANLSDSTTGNVTCGICLGDLADDATSGESERAVHLHSSHFYGEECIRRWLQENDSCPHCREKVHSGSIIDIERHARLVIGLTRETQQLMRQEPSVESPIIERDLLSHFARLRAAVQTVASERLREQLEDASGLLLRWRSQWWKRNPAFFEMSEFAPYTPSSRQLQTAELNRGIFIRGQPSRRLVLDAINAGYSRGMQQASRGEPVHVATHPLSFSISSALGLQLRKDEGEWMSAYLFAARLRNAVERSQRLEGLLCGEREDLPAGLQDLCEDLIGRILQAHIDEQ